MCRTRHQILTDVFTKAGTTIPTTNHENNGSTDAETDNEPTRIVATVTHKNNDKDKKLYQHSTTPSTRNRLRYILKNRKTDNMTDGHDELDAKQGHTHKKVN